MKSTRKIVPWTEAKVAGLAPHQRHELWNKVRHAKTEEELALKALIERCGLPYTEPGSLKSEDPIAMKIYDIINSPAGRAACVEATEKGLPAVAGVDRMIGDALGVDYGPANMSTNWAGVYVGDLMRSLGYVHGGDRPMPKGSVAKTAALWIARR